MTESIAVGESALESDTHTSRDGDSTSVMADAFTGATINGGEGDAIDDHVDISPVAIEVCRAFSPFSHHFICPQDVFSQLTKIKKFLPTIDSQQ